MKGESKLKFQVSQRINCVTFKTGGYNNFRSLAVPYVNLHKIKLQLLRRKRLPADIVYMFAYFHRQDR